MALVGRRAARRVQPDIAEGGSRFSVSPSELAELRHQATELHATVTMLVAQAEATDAVDRPVPVTARAALDAALESALESAESAAARRSAERIIATAELRSEEILANAYRVHDRIVEQARAAELAAARRVEALVELLHRSGEAARGFESELTAVVDELGEPASVVRAADLPSNERLTQPTRGLFTSTAVTF